MLSASISSLRQRSYLYDLSLVYCYKNYDFLVFFTDATRKRLHKLERIETKREVIKWGVSPLEYQEKIRKKWVRKKYSLDLSKKIVLWSGFISQVKEEDFLCAIKVARDVLKSKNNCQFIFCFKPSRVKEKYYSFENYGIKIMTNISNFHEFLHCGDIFLCPIANSSKSLAPPLTWIEAMASGLPVMTTNVEGANEIVIDGETGYVSSNVDILSRKLLYVLENEKLLSHMSPEAQKK